MATLIRDLMNQVEAFCKEAGERESENITGQDPDSMPGSENDKNIPEGATKDDPKVKDETINNTDARNLDGATPGSDAPVVEKGLESSEAVLNPDKKPLDTADANAKEASALGNNLVSMILGAKKAAAEKKAAEEKKAAPAEKKAEPSAKITVDMAMMAKIAAITLADEEGQLAVQSALTKRAGAEFAAEVFGILEKRAAEERARYEFEKGAQDAEAMIGDLQEAQGAADAEAALAGAADAAPAEPAMGADEAAAALNDFSADEVAEAVQELADEGQIDPATAQQVAEAVQGAAAAEGASTDVSEDDLADALTEAIDSGELTVEDAQALISSLSEGASDGAAVEELKSDVAGDAAPAEAAPEESPEAEKAAAVKKAAAKEMATKLVDAIKSMKK
jgi:hypothetical protein